MSISPPLSPIIKSPILLDYLIDFGEILTMTMDKSLRTRAGLARSRSVYNRAERISRLQQAEKWKEGDSPFGLPKVRVYKLAMKKKKKKAKEEEGDAAAAAPAAAAPGKGAAAKGAPAKGAPAKGAPAKK